MPAPRRFAVLVTVTSALWKSGPFFEVRTYGEGVDPMGRGYRNRCLAVYNDHNEPVREAWGRLGRLILSLMAEDVIFTGKMFYRHATKEWLDINSRISPISPNSFQPWDTSEAGRGPNYTTYLTYKEIVKYARSRPVKADDGREYRFLTTRLPMPRRGTPRHKIYMEAARMMRTSVDYQDLLRAQTMLQDCLNA